MERCTYHGYQLVDLSTLVREGVYRARVAVVPEARDGIASQRFLDFETFPTRDEASLRAIDGGVSWIDSQLTRT